MSPSAGLLVRDEHQGSVIRLTLDRPGVHNAFDEGLVEALVDALAGISVDGQARVVVLDGHGPSFCAGADVASMRASLDLDEAANRHSASRLATLFRDLDACPVPVVTLVHGVALGGGVGLVAASDHVIATDDARFGLTETRLGILPAVIAPYVVARVGPGAARSLILTARRFGAADALRLGLVHQVVAEGESLAGAGRAIVDAILACGPGAVRTAKQLLRALPSLDAAGALHHTVDVIARQRVSDEGQEGLRAFLERRPPTWSIGD